MEKYDDASARHYKDAVLLKAAGSLDNAGHLIGFAAECAIKHHIYSLRGDQAIYVHLPQLRDIAIKHLSGRSRKVYGMLNLLKNNDFLEWNIAGRYYQSGITSEEQLNSWIKSAERLMGVAGIGRLK
jgi:hypothetical protein